MQTTLEKTESIVLNIWTKPSNYEAWIQTHATWHDITQTNPYRKKKKRQAENFEKYAQNS